MDVRQSSNPDSAPAVAEGHGGLSPLHRGTLYVFGAALLAAGLYLFRLGAQSFWLDEGTSFAFSRLPLSELFDLASTRQANMSLYYLLLHFWLGLGESEALIRLLSSLFALATIPLVYLLGRRLRGPAAGLVAAVFLALNAFVVRYAQEARGYTLAMLLAALATYLLIRALDDPRRGRWILYSLVAGIGAYAHFFVLLVLAGHLAGILLTRGGRAAAAPALMSLGGAVVIALPMILFPLTGDRGQIDWLDAPGSDDVVRELSRWVGGEGYPLLVVYGGLGVWGLLHGLRSPSRTAVALVGSWLAAPVIGSLLISLFKPIFLARYLVVSLPALALAAALGVLALRPVLARAAAIVLVVALAASGLHGWYYDYDKEDWRSATRYVLSEARPDDAIVLYAGRMKRPFGYYVALEDKEEVAPTSLYPAGEWGHDPAAPVGRPSIAKIEAAAAARDRIWLVLGHARTGTGARATLAALTTALGRHLQVESSRDFYRVEVRLYSRKPGPP